jgi:hypothetical protein
MNSKHATATVRQALNNSAKTTRQHVGTCHADKYTIYEDQQKHIRKLRLDRWME